jgi:hypothetical protein
MPSASRRSTAVTDESTPPERADQIPGACRRISAIFWSRTRSSSSRGGAADPEENFEDEAPFSWGTSDGLIAWVTLRASRPRSRGRLRVARDREPCGTRETKSPCDIQPFFAIHPSRKSGPEAGTNSARPYPARGPLEAPPAPERDIHSVAHAEQGLVAVERGKAGRAAPGAYTLCGPPERITPQGSHRSISAREASGGRTTEKTFASRTRRAISCVY